MQEDLKLEAKLIEDTEARCAKYQLHITEERDKYQVYVFFLSLSIHSAYLLHMKLLQLLIQISLGEVPSVKSEVDMIEIELI